MVKVLIGAEAVSLIVTLILVISGHFYTGTNSKKRAQWFLVCAAINLVMLVADAATYLMEIEGIAQKYTILYALALTVSYMGGFLLIAAFFQYVYVLAKERQGFPVRYLRMVIVISLAVALFVLLQCVTGNGLLLDEGAYVRFMGIDVVNILAVVVMLFEIMALAMCSKALMKKEFAVVALYFLFPIINIVLGAFITEVSFVYVASTLSLLLIYLLIQSEKLSLTRKLESERTMFRDAIGHSAMFHVVADITDGVITEDIVDPSGRSLLADLGFSVPAPFDEESKAFLEQNEVEILTRGGERIFTREGITQMYEEGITIENVELHLKRADAYVRLMPILSIDSQNGHLISICPCTDITERMKQELELQEKLQTSEIKEQRSQEVLTSLASVYDTMHLIDFEKNTVDTYSTRSQVQDIVRANEKQQLQMIMWEVMSKRVCAEHFPNIKEFTDFETLAERMEGRRMLSLEAENVDNQWWRFSFIRIGEPDEEIKRIIFTSYSIDELKREEEKLKHISMTDELTGLFNRHAYEVHVAEIEQLGIGDDLWFVGIDLNDLKTANDTKGHKAGDELLIATATCCKGAFGEYGKAYRVGGDEFMAIVRCSEKEMKEVISDLDRRMKEWKGTYSDSFSFAKGYVCSGEFQKCTIATLEREADVRMYADKQMHYKRNRR